MIVTKDKQFFHLMHLNRRQLMEHYHHTSTCSRCQAERKILFELMILHNKKELMDLLKKDTIVKEAEKK